MRPPIVLLLSGLIVLTPVTAVLAKDEKSKEPADKKQILVDQIIDAVKAEKLTDEERDELKKKGQERLDRVIDTIADKTQMSPEEKQKLKDKMSKGCPDRQAQGLSPELKQRIESQLAIKEFCRNMSYQVMGDHLEDRDLKAILKFIKSSTGKKLIKQAPDMMAQMLELAAERYIPIGIDMMKQFKVPEGLAPGSQQMSPEQRRELMEKLKRLLQRNGPQTSPGKDET